MSINWRRLSCLSGVAFVGLALVSFSLFGNIDTDHAEKIPGDFADHRARIIAGTYMACLGLVALAIWGWAWWNVLREKGGDQLGVLVFVFTALTVAVEFPVMGTIMSLAYISDQAVTPQVARALLGSAQVFSYIDYFPTFLLFVSLAWAILETGVVNRWFGWTAFLASLVSLVVAYPTLKADLVGGSVDGLWIVAASVALFLSPASRFVVSEQQSSERRLEFKRQGA